MAKAKSRAIAMRLVTASGSTSPTSSTTPAPSRKWTQVGTQVECDAAKGELYLKNSSGKVSSIEQCRKSCEDSAGCKSITYFKSGFCGHFSTMCTNVVDRGNVVASWRSSATRRRLLVMAFACNGFYQPCSFCLYIYVLGVVWRSNMVGVDSKLMYYLHWITVKLHLKLYVIIFNDT